jgi:4-amino-4-deoxy-L-arabinose transferase-like glycosyltransferase
MTTSEFVLLARNRFERLFEALIDPARCERAMLLLFGGYVATWSLYAAIAKSSQDIHSDMGEIVAWSREAVIGTPKHPPLAAWLVRAWFSVFPREDWAYYLFAMILPTVALWITWRIAARYLPRDKRVVGIALLTLIPFYNFHALKFNVNTVLTPLWAATTWWFLRSFETRRAGWAMLAGFGAAAAMLGKYWSVVLLAGLGLAALTDPRRDDYFSSPAPYLTLAVGTILLTPHVDWMIANQFASFAYAVDVHPATLLTAARSALSFIGSSLGYVAVPLVLSLFAAQPGMTAIRDTLWPLEPERRILVIAFAAQFLVAALVTVVLRVEINSVWAISAMTLFPVVLLSSPLVTIPRSAALRLMALAIVFPLVMVAVSPIIAVVIHRERVPNHEDDYQLVAQAVERAWSAHTNKPLRIVGSFGSLVDGTAFYFASQPSIFDIVSPAQTPWVDDDRIRREGMAMVCPDYCMGLMKIYAAHYHATQPEHVAVTRRYFGTQDTPEQYEIVIILPQTQ